MISLTDPKSASYVNAKVKKYIALAPVVFTPNFNSMMFKIVASNNILVDAAKLFGLQEWLPGSCSTSSIQSKFQEYVCKLNPLLCNFGLGLVDTNPKYDNKARMPFFMQHTPSGSSLRCLIHYKQLMGAPKNAPYFRMFDFGAQENQKRYGQSTPPMYDFKNINIPVRGFVGQEDVLGDPKDNAFLKNILVNNLKSSSISVWIQAVHTLPSLCTPALA